MGNNVSTNITQKLSDKEVYKGEQHSGEVVGCIDCDTKKEKRDGKDGLRRFQSTHREEKIISGGDQSQHQRGNFQMNRKESVSDEKKRCILGEGEKVQGVQKKFREEGAGELQSSTNKKRTGSVSHGKNGHSQGEGNLDQSRDQQIASRKKDCNGDRGGGVRKLGQTSRKTEGKNRTISHEDKLRLVCPLCNVVSVNAEQHQQHMNGKRHNQTVNKSKSDEMSGGEKSCLDSRSKPGKKKFFCERCNILSRNETEHLQHMRGKRHKQMVEKCKSKKLKRSGKTELVGDPDTRNALTRNNQVESKFPKKENKPYSAQPSKEINNFCLRLQKSLVGANPRNKKTGAVNMLMQPEMKDLWFRTWATAAEGAIQSPVVLLNVLLLLPATSMLLPPVKHVLPVLVKITEIAGNMSGDHSSEALNILEMVVDCVCNRLRHSNEEVDLCDELVHHIDLLPDTLRSSIACWFGKTDQTKRCATLMISVEHGAIDLFREELKAKMRSSNDEAKFGSDGVKNDPKQWEAWHNPRLQWLLDGAFEWLKAPQLQTQYDSISDYVQTLQQMMTLLTFYWGAGAVWPKCRYVNGSNGDRPCQQPLLTAVGADRKGSPVLKCFNCKDVANWRCPIFQHGHALCNKCVQMNHKCQIGKPSTGSSTDLYDAVVERESTRRDGQVYFLSEVESRRPPKIHPNWRTSYRLQCSGLVAVLNLDASHVALSPNQEIFWAQIVSIDERDQNQECRYRSRGQMAVRLLTRGDLGVLQQSLTPILEVGTRVAVIDLRIFVPEVVPVLAACCDPALANHLSQIPFANQLIGNAGDINIVEVGEGSTNDVIERVIANSNLEVIRRLSPDSQNRLTNDLSKIATKAHLEGAQLMAFASALTNSLHCTQGPPGTGKSYVGVQLLFALDRIRSEALSSGHSVGPILVLSYKNHALDEILLDILDGLPKKQTAFTKDLIRCGNPENDHLQPYKEKRNPVEAQAEKVLSSCLSTLRRSGNVATSWLDLGSYIELSLLSLPNTNIINQAGSEAEELLSKDALQLLGGWKDMSNMHAINSIVNAIKFLHRLVPSINNFSKNNKNAVKDENELIRNRLSGINDSDEAFSLLESIISTEERETVKALEVIVGLEECTRYWSEFYIQVERTVHNGNRLEFLVTAWLCGMQPPPQCKVAAENGDECNLPALTTSPYCRVHSCKIVDCQERKMDGFFYCKDHSCDDARCELPSVNNFNFCREHLCITCHEFNLSPGRRKCHDMRAHTCIEHKCLLKTCRHHRISLHSDFKLSWMSFCEYHSCQKCLDVGESTQVDDVCPQSGLCKEHRCSHHGNRCTSIQVDNILSRFCRNHTCHHCLDAGIEAKPVIEAYPRNSCAMHTLCNYINRNGYQCNALAKEGLYCIAHSEKNLVQVTCKGITTKNKPCKTKGKAPVGHTNWYCVAHESQAPQESSSEENSIDSDNELCDTDSDIDEEEWDSSSVSTDDLDKEDPDSISITCVDITAKEKPCTTKEKMQENDKIQFFPPHTIKAPAISMHIDEMLVKPELEMGLDLDTGTKSKLIVKCNKSFPEIKKESRTPLLSNLEMDMSQKQVELTRNHFEPDEVQLKENMDVKPKLSSELKVKLNTASSIIVPVESKQDPEENCISITSIKNDVGLHEAHEDGFKDDYHVVDQEYRDPDEIDFEEYCEEDDVDYNDDQQRLYDILGSSSDSENSEEEAIFHDCCSNSGTKQEIDKHSMFIKTRCWSWSMSIRERWASAATLLKVLSEIIKELRILSEKKLEMARQDKAVASAEAFKSARVIGATVAGAAKRFKALRAAEPFAVIVEEACEVMEPLLMAIVTIRSLKKLELIGDHRQLPAFIQNCWFNLERTHRSIKVSLFERLVESPSEIVPCHILQEQRRMRPEISDLTREHYADIVQIEDNECTVKQRIGDAFMKCYPNFENDKFNLCRKSWSNYGNLVPGVIPQVFFWTLQDNRESRPISGLSACNEVEAEAVVQLVQWHLTCGVPPSAISVITPYKGQSRLIVRKLRLVPGAYTSQTARISKQTQMRGRSRFASKNCVTNSVIVSTVDRYQGDENDIVILSLVRTKPGNRFVALQNRFIVAVSRARIGFYVVGSPSAVTEGHRGGKGPLHWCNFVQNLQHDKMEKNSPDDFSDESSAVVLHEKESRVGPSITICCPRHRQSQQKISNANKLINIRKKWERLCTEQCTHTLDWCGHTCGLTCHDSLLTPHTTLEDCRHLLIRPCVNHADVELLCGDLYKRADNAKNLRSALENFECEVQTTFERKDCSHKLSLQCHKTKAIEDGNLNLPNCVENVEDYIHPVCNHVTPKPTCHNRRKWEIETPTCHKKVQYRKSCGCVSKMECWKKQEELKHPTKCMNFVNIKRPRCSHLLSLRCHQANTIRSAWEVEAEKMHGNSIDDSNDDVIVEQGIVYGPSETEIKHLLMNNGSAVLDNLPQCPECHVKVHYRSECSHMIETTCDIAFKWSNGSLSVPNCEKMVTAKSPVCGKDVLAPCYLVKSDGWKKFPQMYYENGGSNKIEMSEVMLKEEAPPLPTIIDQVLRNQCSHSIEVLQKCGHKIDVPCNNIFKRNLPLCKQIVKRTLTCGHEVEVECHSDKIPKCMAPTNETFVFSCGVHSIQPGTCHRLSMLRAQADKSCMEHVQCKRFRCRHLVSAPCFLKNQIEAFSPGPGLMTDDVVVAGNQYCDDSNIAGSVCKHPVTFKDICGHYRSNVLCYQAFEWAVDSDKVPPCKHNVSIDSPLCGHALDVPCHLASSVRQWNPWPDGKPWEYIQCDIDGEEIACPEFSHDMTKPQGLPCNWEDISCKYQSVVNLSCGHTTQLPCVQAISVLTTWKCTELVSVKCDECGHEKKMKCHTKQYQDRTGLKDRCENKVKKKCFVCQINSVVVECYKDAVYCNEKVNFKLKCGHEVTWLCGSENDPRKEIIQCRSCMFSLWEKTVEKFYENTTSLEQLQAMVNDKLSDLDEYVTSNRLNLLSVPEEVRKAMENLHTAQMKIIATYKDLIGEHDVKIAVKAPPNLSDAQNFDIVFAMKKPHYVENDFQLNRRSFQPGPTRYGRASKLTILMSESINALFTGGDSEITLCVGVAYKHMVLSNSDPFRANNCDKKGKKAANKMALKKMHEGFDCVLPKGRKNIFSCIYWIPGTCVPLEMITFRRKYECQVCFITFRLNDGIQCTASDRHFLCNDCFSSYVESESTTESLDLLAKRDGCIFCASCPRDKNSRFTDADVAQHVPDNIFALYSDGKKKLLEHQLSKKIEEDTRKRLEAERKRLDAMTKEQQQIHTARQKIEAMLNLTCPNCDAAFEDFDGCMSVKCGQVNCGIAFCGWCLKNCGNDAHAHAGGCDLPAEAGEPGGLFRREKESWMRVHRYRQRKEIIAYILELPSGICGQVAQTCHQVLLDAGVTGVYEQIMDANLR